MEFASVRNFAGLMLLNLMWAGDAQAIVNLKNLYFGEPEPGFSGSLTLGLNGVLGNSSNIRTKGVFLGQWYQPGRLDYINANYAFGKTTVTDTTGHRVELEDVNNWLIHARHVHDLTSLLAWEAFGQIESNRFNCLTDRELFGGGMRWTYTDTNDGKAVFYGAGLFNETERIAELSSTTDAGKSQKVRSNFYIVAKRKFFAATTLQSTTYLQHDITHFADYRLLEDASLTVGINDKLGLSLTATFKFDSLPPQQIKQGDLTYSANVVYEF